MNGTGDVAKKIGMGPFTVLAWVLGMTACNFYGASPPTVGEVPATGPAAILAVTVPDGGWHGRVERVFEREGEVWILVQLQRTPGPAAQMVRAIELTLPAGLPVEPRRIFVAGKTWNWANPERYEFVPSLADVIRQAGASRVIYPVPGGTR